MIRGYRAAMNGLIDFLQIRPPLERIALWLARHLDRS